MRFNKPLLIYTYYAESGYGEKNTTPPLGLGYISEMLKKEQIEHYVLDLGLGYSLQDTYKRIRDNEIDLVCISMMSLNFKKTYEMIEQIKNENPNVKIVVGGPHVTAHKTDVLSDCKSIDFGVVGEGEYTLVELCNENSLEHIDGLIYRNGTEIVYTRPRKPLENLDILPYPKFEKFELNKYNKMIQILSSRGCPYKCIFCQQSSMLGKKWRGRSAENMVEEIEYWVSKNYKSFHFVDDNFTLNKKRVLKFCDLLDKNIPETLYFSTAGVRIDNVNEELLIRMKEVGFNYLSFGIEGGNDKMLKILKKGITIEQIHKTLEIAERLEYQIKLYFIIGSPYETLDDVQDSINLAMRYPLSCVRFTNMLPYEGSELMEWINDGNAKLLYDPNYYLNNMNSFFETPIFDGPGMTLNEKQVAIEMTRKAIKKIEWKNRYFRWKKLVQKITKHPGIVKETAVKVIKSKLS